MLHFSPEAVRDRVNADPEFRLAARYWSCTVVLEMGDTRLEFVVEDGKVAKVGPAGTKRPDIRFSASEGDWRELLAAVPRPSYQSLPYGNNESFTIEGDRFSHVNPYFGALRRLVAVLREEINGPAPQQAVPDVDRLFDTAVGRYVYIQVEGVQYRVYFEEAGEGIPLVLQHTAGADGRQWRHLLEDADLQRRYRMIAYDLPYHGRSLPPTGIRWWEEQYRLTKPFLMDTVIAINHALELDRPVFMGCSIGGHLAPDLALYHPEEFRAVIGVNAWIHTPVADPSAAGFNHPRISNEWKASAMLGSTSPTSPEAYRRETAWVYSQGAPPVLEGDVYYYGKDHNLTGLASKIDTARVDVYLLSGEYDRSVADAGAPELARQIPGAKYQIIKGVGHFGSSENPERFKESLMPVLDEIYAKHG